MMLTYFLVSTSGGGIVDEAALADAIRGGVFYWGSQMAGALQSSIPIVVTYSWFVRRFLAGLTAGDAKY